ncbi:MAG: glycine/betaine ABC transporter substrate-binding protein [Deltaproteobacteria bacterium]|jgi:osmoprotectant transport system permease protein|nr:glycine/betaine ABC transporter substrate-binding protein [Deltaproteobacteria bacterium]
MAGKRFIICAILLALFGLVSCGQDQKSDQPIRLGLDNTAEEAILGELLVYLIETKAGIKVEVTPDLAGGETVMHPAMVKGDLDLYPEYTGTAWLAILKEKEIPEREELQRRLFEEYGKRFNFEWVGLYGFNNSYGLGVTGKVAREYDLKTYSDLAKVSEGLTFRAESGFFEREDGFKGLTETYGMKFKEARDVAFSLKYNAIEDGQADVINIFTTDGRLANTDVVTLVDDKNYFPEYRCGTVVRREVLEKNPKLKDALMLMDGLIDDASMAGMNFKVESQGREPKEVAQEFLTEKGLM